MLGGTYSIVQLALPVRPLTNIGILLLDVSNDKLYMRWRADVAELAGPDEGAILGLMAEEFEIRLARMGGDAFVQFLEETLANVLRITAREPITVADFDRDADALFRKHVLMARAASA